MCVRPFVFLSSVPFSCHSYFTVICFLFHCLLFHWSLFLVSFITLSRVIHHSFPAHASSFPYSSPSQSYSLARDMEKDELFKWAHFLFPSFFEKYRDVLTVDEVVKCIIDSQYQEHIVKATLVHMVRLLFLA